MTDATLDALSAANERVDKLRFKLRHAMNAAEMAHQAHTEASKPTIPTEPGRNQVDPNATYSTFGTAVIVFTKTFNAAGIYHYAAIRPAGSSQWVITTASSTQTHGRKYTWAQLMSFVAEKEPRQGKDALASVQEWIRKW